MNFGTFLIQLCTQMTSIEASDYDAPIKRLDVTESLRKFTNRNATLVATKLLEMNYATFRELQKETKLSTNILTHTIHTLKNADIIVKEGEKYYLTKYGVILLEAIDHVRERLKTTTLVNKEDLFAASSRSNSKGYGMREDL